MRGPHIQNQAAIRSLAWLRVDECWASCALLDQLCYLCWLLYNMRWNITIVCCVPTSLEVPTSPFGLWHLLQLPTGSHQQLFVMRIVPDSDPPPPFFRERPPLHQE